MRRLLGSHDSFRLLVIQRRPSVRWSSSSSLLTFLSRQQQHRLPYKTLSSSRSSCFTTDTTDNSANQLLRIAIVGNGAAGMTTALHLAPLVAKGLIDTVDMYGVSKPRRDIGVGIWSTAIDPFVNHKTTTTSDETLQRRPSHEWLYQQLTSHGSFVGPVGYRTPNGAWLMKSQLPTEHVKRDDSSNNANETNDMPLLLFLKEGDFLQSLREAVQLEQEQGTITVHEPCRVVGLQEDSTLAWSTRLVLSNGDKKDASETSFSDRDYHLILAADGTNSILRQVYGGHAKEPSLISTSVGNAASTSSSGSSLSSPNELPSLSDTWKADQQQEAVGLQDRHYTVFRGNSPLTGEQVGENGVSFQTWGEGKSMRFATVPMFTPGTGNTREERQVWFITIDDDAISSEPDPAKRQRLLLDTFHNWHDPVCRIVEATPPEDILMERAIAHRHSMAPVLNFNRVVKSIRGTRPPSSGQGPCLIFTGDAYMTVDPILAQGFTIAMEGAYALAQSVEATCTAQTSSTRSESTLAFDPFRLRDELQRRHDGRINRLICLLRATEMVQALGQPQGGSLTGILNTKLLRPLTRLTPNFIKAPVFDAVLKYSLGLLKSDSNKTR